VVKKKIAGQQPKPKIEPLEATAQTPQTAPAQAGESKTDKPAAETVERGMTDSKLVEESKAFSGSYNPKGRFDPFEPLFKSEQDEVPAPKGSRKRRKPQTPLERVALSQLKLSAIMRTAKGNSAIVEDATGKGYVIRKGTYIGLNSGQVVDIDKDRVLIEEESEDISGELRIQNTELKLQKPAGEL
jgi:type IV pilus assembly protein PilP